MSDTNSSSTDCKTVRRILADLILIAERNGLPEPDSMRAHSEALVASVTFASRPDLDAWASAFNIQEVRSQVTGPDGRLHNASTYMGGWLVSLSARTPEPEETVPLDAEALAELAALAAAPSPVPAMQAASGIGGES